MVIKINDVNHRFWGMLSLAMKAGALKAGEGRAQDAIRGGSASMIILSQDASANTEKKFSDMGNFRSLPVISVSDRYALGRAIGKKFAVVIAVCDRGFSDNIMKILITDNNIGKDDKTYGKNQSI